MFIANRNTPKAASRCWLVVDAPLLDVFTDADALTDWRRARDLVEPDERADEDDLDLVRAFRSGLRTAMRRHHEDGSTAT